MDDMPRRILLLTALLALTVSSVSAQAQETESPFRPLDLATPNTVRNASGRPGADYWQQRADYRIAASLDPATNVLAGKETIRYENHSPDALGILWMHVEPNMCAPGSVSNTLRQPPLVFLGAIFDFSCQGFEGGLTLSRVAVGGREVQHHVFGTTMRLDLHSALAAGASVEIQIEWNYVLPPYGMARMGRDGSLYEVAQWYPRMAVYDDVKGWNNEPYIGAGEFYLEYGDFDVELTLPSEFVVAATGVLQNPEEVLSAAQRDRLRQAMTSADPVSVITKAEAVAAGGRAEQATSGGQKTWHFRADMVRDFAFAASPDYRWDATNWDGILIQTMYRSTAPLWEEAILMSRESIRHFSEKWSRYPYPHATTVEGPIEGMEYPMLTFVPDFTAREDLHWVVSHEFGHEWFPILVGSNERLYPWMDEGFNTYMDLEGASEYFAGTDYGASIRRNPLALYTDNAIPGEEQAMGTAAAEQSNLFWTAYQKPALMLTLLKEEVLGPARFDAGFKAYIAAWSNRHPTPADFFRIMRDVSGMDLDWFWRAWVLSPARLDQSVRGVVAGDDGRTTITIANKADMVMPVELRIDFAGGISETVRLPVEMWNQGPLFAWTVPGTRAVTRVVIDPREVYPDDDRGNNSWPR
ncbi:MAG: hypothetical protein ACI80V_002923 [Rhodothermales bacterium]|jgi:hypothetical protein